MKSWTPPTPDQLAKAIARLRHPQQRRHFFNNLQNPLWLRPLCGKGFFSDPPRPIKDETAGTVRYPPWPEGRYLARMATHDPSTVADIISSIPDKGNVFVYEDLADAALAMPSQHAAWIVDRAKAWLDCPHLLLLPAKLGELMARFAKGAHVDQALSLAATLLEILSDDQWPARRSALGPQPRPKFAPHDYAEVVRKYVPDLTAAAPERALRLFCDLLEKGIEYSQRPEYRNDKEDASYVWCPAVEECRPEDRLFELQTIFVFCVREAAAQWASAEPTCLRDIVALYDSKPWCIFERLSYHLLARFPDKAMDLVAQRLTDRTRFDVFETRYEYERLQEACFAQLSGADRAKVLGWIDKGPDAEAYADGVERLHVKRPDAAEVQEYMDRWRRDRLAPIEDSLPLEWRQRYDALVLQYGDAHREPFRAFGGVEWGHQSPVTADELAKKDVSEIVSFLWTWRETDRFHGPSYEGLVDTLKCIISRNPRHFVPVWEQFRSLAPRYFYALLKGFYEAVQKDWDPHWWTDVLAACEWAVQQPEALAHDTDQVEPESPSWSWVGQAVLGLLERGFELEQGDRRIPIGQRNETWSILQRLIEHPDPSPEEERRHIEHYNMDLFTLSRNSVRGQTLHAVVRYALWLRRHFEAIQDNQAIALGFGAMPEVAHTLERHLDPTNDPSLAIRAVYGQWFPWLCFLDQEWAVRQVPRVFPDSGDQEAYFDAAWTSYISYDAAYNDVFEILRPVYRRAIENLQGAKDASDGIRDPAKRLAEHLMLYYGRGRIGLEDDILRSFYVAAPASVRAHAIHFVGWSLGREEKKIPEDVVERFRRLWDWRAREVLASPDHQSRKAELMAFGLWYASGKFPSSWALSYLKDILKNCRAVEGDHFVFEQLAADVHDHPGLVLQCVELLIEGDSEGWTISGAQDNLKALFTAALRSGDQQIVTKARALVNRLGARGFMQFGDLLR